MLSQSRETSEDKRRTTLEVSLACLVHPLSLTAIAVLVLNDHALKATHPSWWTGKLSDFAGLFFFPFLITLLVGVALPTRASRRTGAVAAGFTGLWFAVIKTSALGNQARRE